MTRRPSTDEPVGQLQLSVEKRAGRAIARRQYFQGALRVLRPHYLDDSDQVTYTIVNPGGGYLGGDVYTIDVDVAAETSMVLTSQSATKVYKTPDEPAYQRSVFRLGPASVLEYVPDQLIAYREADYIQDTVVEMDPSATFISTEILTPGWAPDGTLFRYERVQLRQEVRINARPYVVDNLIVRPDQQSTPVESALYMDGRSHLGTLLCVDARVDRELIDELRQTIQEALDHTPPGPHTPSGEDRSAAAEPLMGISAVEGPGLTVRILGTSTEQVAAGLNSVVNRLRDLWRGQGPLQLRKY